MSTQVERAGPRLMGRGEALVRERGRLDPVLMLFGATILVSAGLLFLVQPMFAKMVLPMLGGSPAVWNTTVVFYQAVLLAGYAYAHASTRWLGVRRQAVLHAGLLLLPFLVLPIAVPGGWRAPTESSPIPWLLALLAVAVGLPFFVVSTSSPLLQRWFAGSGHHSARDPYFLYAASNAGSMLALLSYPFLVEPTLRLAEQSWVWALGYGLLVALTLACAVVVWRAKGPTDAVAQPSAHLAAAEPLSAGRKLRWVLLAFVPSSLMLSVTAYLSDNITPIPLLWVVPLGLYLLTFILVFASRPPLPHHWMSRALPMTLMPLLVVMFARASQPIGLLIALHLATFFIAAMICHGELAKDRPSPRHLTEFYLWMSVGGVLGGMFNALLAPVLFTTVLEYPLALVAACLLRPRPVAGQSFGKHDLRLLDLLFPAALGGMVGILIVGLQEIGLRSGPLSFLLMFGLPSVVCYGFGRRPVRFAAGVAALFLASTLYSGEQGTVLNTERSFFGIHRVVLDPFQRYFTLFHGGTLHGMQSRDPARRDEPLTYFTRSGPIGQLFESFAGGRAPSRVAVVGLGAGTLACYSQPGQDWTFYEIDPVVEHIARDARYFSFLEDCAPSAKVILGDARLSLVDSPAQHYDLLVLDAFSSDTVPLHLMTRQAVALYLDKLAPHGVIVFQLSNRYLDLKPVVGNLAQDAGLFAVYQEELVLTDADLLNGKLGSQWAVVAREPADLAALTANPRWHELAGRPSLGVWTDDYSSVLSVMYWR